MSRLTELTAKLTPSQLQEVEDFAEFLATRSPHGAAAHPSRINADGLMGLCEGMGGDKTDKELVREAWDGVVDKLER
jgi:hypothetical protein